MRLADWARRAPDALGRLLVALVALSAAGLAMAADGAADPVPAADFSLAKVFALLFLMLGPFKIVGPFARLMQGAEPTYVRRLALLASAFSGAALLIAALIGERVLGNFGPLTGQALCRTSLLAILRGIKARAFRAGRRRGWDQGPIQPRLIRI